MSTPIDILKHPTVHAAYELCLSIENLPASEQQTKLSLQASALLSQVSQSVDDWRELAAKLQAYQEWLWEVEGKGLLGLAIAHGYESDPVLCAEGDRKRAELVELKTKAGV